MELTVSRNITKNAGKNSFEHSGMQEEARHLLQNLERTGASSGTPLRTITEIASDPHDSNLIGLP